MIKNDTRLLCEVFSEQIEMFYPRYDLNVTSEQQNLVKLTLSDCTSVTF